MGIYILVYLLIYALTTLHVDKKHTYIPVLVLELGLLFGNSQARLYVRCVMGSIVYFVFILF